MKSAYQNSWKQIVQPLKYEYYPQSLGAKKQLLSELNKTVVREDFDLENNFNYQMKASFFSLEDETTYNAKPCIIYLHSHAGNRLEGLPLVRHVFPHFNLCIFDFTGCGMSEGEYVTLGLKETEDTISVIKELKNRFGIDHFYLWGRSAGAATAILLAKLLKDSPQFGVIGSVYDSPFENAKSMISNMMSDKLKIPSFLVKTALIPLGKSIKANTGFDVLSVSPEKEVHDISIPGFFMVSTKDKITPPKRVKRLFSKYGGEPKQMFMMEGEHNEMRSNQSFIIATMFLKACWEKFKMDQANVQNTPKLSTLINQDKKIEEIETGETSPDDNVTGETLPVEITKSSKKSDDLLEAEYGDITKYDERRCQLSTEETSPRDYDEELDNNVFEI